MTCRLLTLCRRRWFQKLGRLWDKWKRNRRTKWCL